MTERSEERTTAGRVHVVRHTFKPSEPFEKLITGFVGQHVKPDFLLRSTKEIYVDSVTFARGGYIEEDKLAHEEVNRVMRHPFIIARTAMSILYKKTAEGQPDEDSPTGYRIAFLPVEIDRFNSLEEGLAIYPSVTPSPVIERHHMYLDLPLEAAFMVARKEKEQGFKDTIIERIPDRLFSAAVTGIRSKEDPLKRAFGTQAEATNK